VIVLAHELGHFILGKKNGITVVEFFIGMGPALFSFTRGGTKFSLRIFPLGGACIFEGETGYLSDAEDEEEGEPEKEKPELSEGSFLAASVWARFSTILAGPAANFLLAYLMGLVIVANTGIDPPVVGAVGGQAEIAGLQAGDVITRINNERIHLYRQILFISYANRGEVLNVTYERDGERHTAVIAPVYNEDYGRYLMGISSTGSYEKSGGLAVFRDAYYELGFGTVSTFKSLFMLVRGQLGKDDVAGPVGIATIVGDTYEMAQPYGWTVVVLSMLNIAMIISVNLAIMNLLPLPALDGGRLVFILLEMVRGKPIAPEKEGMVHLAGLIALMVLMVFILFNDISRLF
jgi:regulator of sigma E protease